MNNKKDKGLVNGAAVTNPDGSISITAKDGRVLKTVYTKEMQALQKEEDAKLRARQKERQERQETLGLADRIAKLETRMRLLEDFVAEKKEQ